MEVINNYSRFKNMLNYKVEALNYNSNNYSNSSSFSADYPLFPSASSMFTDAIKQLVIIYLGECIIHTAHNQLPYSWKIKAQHMCGNAYTFIFDIVLREGERIIISRCFNLLLNHVNNNSTQ